MSQEIKRVRAQMEENEDLAILMRGLRGQNLKDSQFAEDDVQLRLVEVCFENGVERFFSKHLSDGSLKLMIVSLLPSLIPWARYSTLVFVMLMFS